MPSEAALLQQLRDLAATPVPDLRPYVEKLRAFLDLLRTEFPYVDGKVSEEKTASSVELILWTKCRPSPSRCIAKITAPYWKDDGFPCLVFSELDPLVCHSPEAAWFLLTDLLAGRPFQRFLVERKVDYFRPAEGHLRSLYDADKSVDLSCEEMQKITNGSTLIWVRPRDNARFSSRYAYLDVRGHRIDVTAVERDEKNPGMLLVRCRK